MVEVGRWAIRSVGGAVVEILDFLRGVLEAFSSGAEWGGLGCYVPVVDM